MKRAAFEPLYPGPTAGSNDLAGQNQLLEYLRFSNLSRLYLDNFDYSGSQTQGKKLVS